LRPQASQARRQKCRKQHCRVAFFERFGCANAQKYGRGLGKSTFQSKMPDYFQLGRVEMGREIADRPMDSKANGSTGNEALDRDCGPA
jgi:hypothetical protein